MQSALRAVYPPNCVSCSAAVETEFGLCGSCWRQTPFIAGLVCDACGTPLPGEDEGRAEYCDDCLTLARPWARGRAAFLYRDKGRDMVLALKHSDRLDLVRPAAAWLSRAARPIVTPDTLVLPVPVHWTRLLSRRYSQSAELARAFARRDGLEYAPSLLIRRRRTPPLEGVGRDARFSLLSNAIEPHPKKGQQLSGRRILLVDDVMTSGATFAVATEACHAAGAREVCILALARVAKDA